MRGITRYLDIRLDDGLEVLGWAYKEDLRMPRKFLTFETKWIQLGNAGGESAMLRGNQNIWMWDSKRRAYRPTLSRMYFQKITKWTCLKHRFLC